MDPNDITDEIIKKIKSPKNFLKLKFLLLAAIGTVIAFVGGGIVFINISLYWIGFPITVAGIIIGGVGVLGGLVLIILDP